MNIAEVLCAHGVSRSSCPAILDVYQRHERSITFGELDSQSARVVRLFEAKGIKAGDGLLVFHPMSIELYTVLVAAFRLGAVPMFLDPSAGRLHIERCCKLWPPKALIASAKAHLLRFVSSALREIPIKFSIGSDVPGAINLAAASSLAPVANLAVARPDTPALVTFTSGSTGVPKAAVRTHEFLLAQHQVLADRLRLVAGQLDLTTLPIFVLANLASGVCSLLPNADLRHPGTIQPGPIIAQIKTHKPLRTAASPAFLERLADHSNAKNITLDELKEVFVGGAPVFPGLLGKLHAVAPKAAITAVYGSTEAEPISEIAFSEIAPADFESMMGGHGLLAGKPVEQIELGVLADKWGSSLGTLTRQDFDAARMAPNAAGEIVVKGKHVLPGYLNGVGDSENKFDVDGVRWHRTGDAGYIDDRGRVWLLGRCEARIRDQRGDLFPFAVECAAQQIPDVRCAAVVSHQGRRLLALELCREADAKLLVQIKSRLAWAQIDVIKVIPRIPVDSRHNAKVNYPELRALLDRS